MLLYSSLKFQIPRRGYTSPLMIVSELLNSLSKMSRKLMNTLSVVKFRVKDHPLQLISSFLVTLFNSERTGEGRACFFKSDILKLVFGRGHDALPSCLFIPINKILCTAAARAFASKFIYICSITFCTQL